MFINLNIMKTLKLFFLAAVALAICLLPDCNCKTESAPVPLPCDTCDIPGPNGSFNYDYFF